MRNASKAVIGTMARGVLILACAAVYGMASGALAETPGADNSKAKAPAEEKAKTTMPQSVYVCPDCQVVSMKAGTCPCGKALAQKHLLCVKDGQALLCDCPAGCTCDAKGVKDGQCACGKAIKKASCKGMYCCPIGCPKISDKPGQCACGMDMKTCN